MIPERVRQVLRDARELAETVRFDDHGRMVGRTFMGGNGGLISQDLLAKAEEVIREIDVIEEQYP